MKQEEERKKTEKKTIHDRQNQEEQTRQNRQRQEQQHQQEQTEKPQTTEQKKEHKDYNLYGNQGMTANQVEIFYKDTMRSLKQQLNQTPQERFKAIQEQNKEKIAQRQQERTLERGEHNR